MSSLLPAKRNRDLIAQIRGCYLTAAELRAALRPLNAQLNLNLADYYEEELERRWLEFCPSVRVAGDGSLVTDYRRAEFFAFVGGTA